MRESGCPILIDGSTLTVWSLPRAQAKLGIVPGGGSFNVQVSVVAAENLPAYGPVTSLGLKADSANPSASFGRLIGIAPVAIASGFSGSVVEVGEVTNPAWSWAPGDYVFLSGTSLSATAPLTGFIQRLGTAKTATTIIVDISDAVLL